MPTTAHDSRLRRYAIFLLLAFAALLYAPYLTRTIRYDEAFTLHYFAISPIVALFDWSAPNNHKLYSLLVWAVHLFIQNDLIALRLPAFLAALISIYLIYRLGISLWGHAAGMVAAAFLATNPVFADFAVNGRGYSLMLALGLAFVMVRHDRLLFWLSIALMLVLPSSVLIVLSRPRLPVLFGLVVGGLLYVPALVWGQMGGAANTFGSTLPDMLGEFGNVFTGTGALLLCVLGFGLWRLSRRLR